MLLRDRERNKIEDLDGPVRENRFVRQSPAPPPLVAQKKRAKIERTVQTRTWPRPHTELKPAPKKATPEPKPKPKPKTKTKPKPKNLQPVSFVASESRPRSQIQPESESETEPQSESESEKEDAADYTDLYLRKKIGVGGGSYDCKDEWRQMIGLGLGESSFAVPEFSEKFGADPLLQENGRDYQSNLDKRLEGIPIPADEPDAPFSREWQKGRLERLDVLKRDPDYTFIKLVAGFAATRIYALYEEEDLRSVVRRQEVLKRGQFLSAEQAKLSFEVLIKERDSLARDLTNLTFNLDQERTAYMPIFGVFDRFLLKHPYFIGLQKREDVYTVINTQNRPQWDNEFITIAQTNFYYGFPKDHGIWNMDRIEELRQQIWNVIFNEDQRNPYNKDEWKKLTKTNARMVFIPEEYNGARDTFVKEFYDFLAILNREGWIVINRNMGKKLYKQPNAQILDVNSAIDMDLFVKMWRELGNDGKRDEQKKGGLRTYFTPAFNDIIKNKPWKVGETIYDFTARLAKDSIEKRLAEKQKLIETTRNLLKTIQERIDRIAKGQAVPITVDEPPYEHRRGWAEAPENSGRVELTPGVMSAISEAFDLVARFVPWARNACDAPSAPRALGALNALNTFSACVTPDFLQHDMVLRTQFAKLVASKWAQNRFQFPNEYKSELNLIQAKTMQHDALTALQIQYKVVTDFGAHPSGMCLKGVRANAYDPFQNLIR